jgi:Ca2+-binding RTX toxin-like protein
MCGVRIAATMAATGLQLMGAALRKERARPGVLVCTATRLRGLDVKRKTILAALSGAALAAGLGATAGPADAAATSATFDGTTATLNLDGTDNNVTVSVSGGLLVHGQTTGGLSDGTDWDSATPGPQTVPANGTVVVAINGGSGNDAITVLAKNTEVAAVQLNGGAGDDVLTGADSNDTLNGGDGNDRLIGGKGNDTQNGDAGNDTLVWNNGDATDVNDGGAGNDATEVNGNATLGDTFTIAPDQVAGRIRFQRTNLVAFTITSTTERFQVNGLGGTDSLTASDGVGARTLLSVDGGAGNDTVNGSDGPDLILGGEGDDVLNGGGGDDRIVGDRGADTMNGGSGDDTLVWNNGDGSDVANGDDGRDDVEVNGAPAAGDVFAVQPNGARIKFDRTNLVPFSIDIGSSETLHANGLGGDDAITVGDVGDYSVTAAGGPDNDTLTGGASSDTLLGGSGNDTINPGGGLDVVSGDEGDDQVNVRDNTADVARGGDGTDSVTADRAELDILDGFENVDRTPGASPGDGNKHASADTPAQADTPAAVDTSTRPVTIAGRTVKVRGNTAAIKLSCPATSASNCTGSLALRTAKAAKLAGRKAILRLGSARYDLAPGTSRAVKVKLANGTKRLANRKGQLAVRAVATTGASGQIATSTRRLTLAIASATKKH